MNHPQIYKIRLISLVLAAALLTTPGIAEEKRRTNIILDQSYSLAPNAIRQTELWETPKGQILIVTEYYCPGHSSYGEARFRLLIPRSEDWRDFEKLHPDSSVAQVRDAACQLLSEGEFELENAEDYSSLGYRLREYNRLGEAVDVFKKAIELYPNEAFLYNNLGNVLRALLQFEEAVVVYRQGIELTSEPTILATIYNGLGNALDDSGNFEEAVEAFRQALEIEPDNAVTHFDLALALYRQEQFDEALQECQLAIQLEPNYVAAKELLKEIEQNQSSQ